MNTSKTQYSDTVTAERSNLPHAIYNRFFDAWDNEFKFSTKPKKIQAIIHSYTAVVVWQSGPFGSRRQKLDRFTEIYNEFLDSIYEASPRGCDFTLAWCPPPYQNAPGLVQAITMIHPFQAEAFHEHAFGEAAKDLDLFIDYIEEEDKKFPMGRWENIAALIAAGAGADGIEGNMRFITTRNTVFPVSKPIIDPDRPLVPRFD